MSLEEKKGCRLLLILSFPVFFTWTKVTEYREELSYALLK